MSYLSNDSQRTPAVADTGVLAALAEMLRDKAYREKHDATGTPTEAGFFHGPNGLLRYPGVDPDVYHTIVGTGDSILNEIPTVPTTIMNPTFEVITGIKDGSGSEPDDVCDDAPIGGVFKAGLLTAPFGRYMRQTAEIDVGRLGQRVDRADPLDLRLVNRISGRTPWTSMEAPADLLTSEFARVFYERAVAFHRLLSKQIWTGNPANNNAGGGYKEFAGLELQINSIWKDAITGATLPSLAPDIRNFGLNISDNGDDLVAILTNMYRNREILAMNTGMMPVRWAFVMRSQMFYELAAVWPCAYITNMCSQGEGITVNVDRGDQINMRDDMRRNQYLLIDGERVDVIFDNAMTEYTNTTKAGVPAGHFSSDIFLLPFSVVGGRSVLYLEYFDFGNADIARVFPAGFLGRLVADGAFLDVPSQTNYCIKWQARIEPRLILRTPWLAARLTDVRYYTLQQPRQSFPSDPYWVNGGETSRPGPSYVSPGWTS